MIAILLATIRLEMKLTDEDEPAEDDHARPSHQQAAGNLELRSRRRRGRRGRIGDNSGMFDGSHALILPLSVIGDACRDG